MPPFTLPKFENLFFRTLPGAQGPALPSRVTPGVLFTETHPTPVATPELLIASPEVLKLLEISPPNLGPGPFAQLFSGNELPEGTRPYATRYGG
jgi:uncharacterized protein YdiU (UPF0061 family)